MYYTYLPFSPTALSSQQIRLLACSFRCRFVSYPFIIHRLPQEKGAFRQLQPSSSYHEANLCILFFFLPTDGLTDCEDPECCEDDSCSKSQLCHTVPHPIDILLRKQPPAVTASFFERMKFIIEENGLQSYVQRAGFNER